MKKAKMLLSALILGLLLGALPGFTGQNQISASAKGEKIDKTNSKGWLKKCERYFEHRPNAISTPSASPSISPNASAETCVKTCRLAYLNGLQAANEQHEADLNQARYNYKTGTLAARKELRPVVFSTASLETKKAAWDKYRQTTKTLSQTRKDAIKSANEKMQTSKKTAQEAYNSCKQSCK